MDIDIMRIIKHKSLALDVLTAWDYIRGNKKLPSDMAMNIHNNEIIFEPLACCNIFGIIDENYETIYFKE